MGDKRLFWISKCPTCATWPGRFVEACATCAGNGEIREEVNTPGDDGEPITPEWIGEILPPTVGFRGEYQGKFGRIDWRLFATEVLGMWLNGEVYNWRQATRGDLRRLCEALGVTLKEKE